MGIAMKNLRRALKKIEKKFSFDETTDTKWSEKNIRREAAQIRDAQHWGNLNEMLAPVEVEE
jgi:predicted NBD/HSP70 family sugar kinase